MCSRIYILLTLSEGLFNLVLFIFVVELEEHIHILKKSVPGWLETYYIRKTNYLKLSKNADMGPVIRKLEALAAEKSER
jgi:hypothetical protein